MWSLLMALLAKEMRRMLEINFYTEDIIVTKMISDRRCGAKATKGVSTTKERWIKGRRMLSH